MKELCKPSMIGHLLIRDADTKEVLVDKNNSIDYEQMSISLLQSWAQIQTGQLYTMAFGNGGSVVSGIGTITYLTPNTVGLNTSLYNQTYSKTLLPANLQIKHTVGELSTDLVINVTLGFGEPSGQSAFDDGTTKDSYTFDELGLFTFGNNLCTHVIFSPVQKALSRQIEIQYTIRCIMV